MNLFRTAKRAACAIALGVLPIGATADGDHPAMQLLFLGVDPKTDAPGEVPADLQVIAIDALPAENAAVQTVFSARLRAGPVSTFVAAPAEDDALLPQVILVAAAGLERKSGDLFLTLADDRFDLAEFTARASAVVSGLDPANRRIALLHLDDPADVLPQVVVELTSALTGIGFDLMAVTVGGAPAQGCAVRPTQALHYALISGLADRPPFGDGNGVSTAAEVERYLTRALKRRAHRDPACGPRHSLLLKQRSDPAQELIAYSGRAPFQQIEADLDRETYEAMFLLQSDSRDAIEEYLEACRYCPSAHALTERLRDMQDSVRVAALEDEIWARIREDDSPGRLTVYVENCTLCVHQSAVEDRIAELAAKAAAASGERAAFESALAETDLAALKSYAADCVACEHRTEAEAEIARIETDAAFRAEETALAAALETRDPELLQAYLEDCAVCTGNAEVAAALEREAKRMEFSQPCLKMAAVPQLGGPRRLEDIDQDEARMICAAAAQEFPADGLIRTTLGRIAQAAGDFETAKASYAFGMEDEVPSAFGLAAYSHYAPPEGEEIDLIAAEVLAAKGAELGDWLSQEILTVIYSKELIPGKTPEDAFRIAMEIAEESNPLAEFFVGYYYLTGSGVEQSDTEAARWLSRSVGQGYTHANSFLAELHETGAGPDASPEKAADLYWEALQKGDPTAAERLTTQIRDRDRQVVRIIQQKLRDAGAYRGKVDGIPGQGTVAAIRRFAEQLTEQG